ncbi:MAG TPA: glycosyltransferase family 2 protein [Longimicrobiales bacterium]
MIYICIPSYNEARTIGVLLWKIRQVMASFQRDYQILVVDDGSTDATAKVLEPYTRVLPLTVLRNEERRGYAASLEMLLREAVHRSSYPRRDVIVTLQADFTEEPSEIPAFVKRIEGGADVVTGSTLIEPSRLPRTERWLRRALAFLLRRSDWPGNVTDPVSGFRALRVACVKKALESRNGTPLLRWDGWAANAELLQLVLPYCRRVEESPVMPRYDRRLRPTRFNTWATARSLFRFLRARPAVNGGAPPAPATGQEAEPATPSAGRGRGASGRRQSRRGGARRRGASAVAAAAPSPEAGAPAAAEAAAPGAVEAGASGAADAGAVAAPAGGPVAEVGEAARRGGRPPRRRGGRRGLRRRGGARQQAPEAATGGTAAGGESRIHDNEVGPK